MRQDKLVVSIAKIIYYQLLVKVPDITELVIDTISAQVEIGTIVHTSATLG